MAHIYNGILLSHKKKQSWVISSEVDGPRDCHTEWSQKEKNKYHMLIQMYGMLKKKKVSAEPRGRTGIKT